MRGKPPGLGHVPLHVQRQLKGPSRSPYGGSNKRRPTHSLSFHRRGKLVGVTGLCSIPKGGMSPGPLYGSSDTSQVEWPPSPEKKLRFLVSKITLIDGLHGRPRKGRSDLGGKRRKKQRQEERLKLARTGIKNLEVGTTNRGVGGKGAL